MDKTLSYFVYFPPKSNSHGHGVRDKNVRRAVQKVVDSFVGNFNAKSKNELQVSLYYDKGNSLELPSAHKTIEKLNDFLGPAIRESDNGGNVHGPHTITWESTEKNIFNILEYIEKIQGENILPLFNFWISYFYHYGQSDQPYGYIMCSIEAGRLFVRPYLILPFTIEDKRVYELLSKFQSGLPFKLNGKHFRRLGPGKNGYSTWKLDEETQKCINECLG